ncbi:hypothetical protein [Akkermansia muciniphila]|uniref:hypothetical protein n=1 Tax=Akkermansia muciniphila TaxID=239935 RepID=UPI00122FA6E8|nr:hypothetical protein [Akkermansia muciniphila]KAA3384897.1 hypothetical protein F1912_12320 [Akkermansia muciniphila]
MLNHFGKRKCIVSAVAVAGVLLLCLGLALEGSVWGIVCTISGAVLLVGAAIWELLFDRCPFCGKHLHTTIGLHACPYCGEGLDDYHPSNE